MREPNENLKALMKGHRKVRAVYEQMADDDVRVFLNEWANLYATDKKAATDLMVKLDIERQRKKMPRAWA